MKIKKIKELALKNSIDKGCRGAYKNMERAKERLEQLGLLDFIIIGFNWKTAPEGDFFWNEMYTWRFKNVQTKKTPKSAK